MDQLGGAGHVGAAALNAAGSVGNAVITHMLAPIVMSTLRLVGRGGLRLGGGGAKALYQYLKHGIRERGGERRFLLPQDWHKGGAECFVIRDENIERLQEMCKRAHVPYVCLDTDGPTALVMVRSKDANAFASFCERAGQRVVRGFSMEYDPEAKDGSFQMSPELSAAVAKENARIEQDLAASGPEERTQIEEALQQQIQELELNYNAIDPEQQEPHSLEELQAQHRPEEQLEAALQTAGPGGEEPEGEGPVAAVAAKAQQEELEARPVLAFQREAEEEEPRNFPQRGKREDPAMEVSPTGYIKPEASGTKRRKALDERIKAARKQVHKQAELSPIERLRQRQQKKDQSLKKSKPSTPQL